MNVQSQTFNSNGREWLYGKLAAAIRPRPVLTVSQWADGNRHLTKESSPEPGRWRTDRVPYTREIMDVLSAHNPTQKVVLKFGAQLAKTEIALNLIGYLIAHAPAPTLVVLPTMEVRKRWVKQRLDPMLRESPALIKIMGIKRRDSGNSEDMKDFPGGILVLGGSNSGASLSSMPVRYLICDEIDRFPWEIKGEGDTLGITIERTKAFTRRKILLMSTPTTAGFSRIEAEYLDSDQRSFYLPCPHCGEYQPLKWQHPDGELSLFRSPITHHVTYRCHFCSREIQEKSKTAMLAAGQWRPRYLERDTRGYHLSGLYAALNIGLTWAEIYSEWVQSRTDTGKLRRFMNTALGEVFEEAGETIDHGTLLSRLEIYPPVLPPTVRTCGLDVQKDRLELSVIDWGAGEEAWLHDHFILPGDTAMPDVWRDLADTLDALSPAAVGLDTGYNTEQVFAFCAHRNWCYPLKGLPGMDRPIAEDPRRRMMRLRYRRKAGHAVYIAGVDSAKSLLYARLRLQTHGAGYVHFPNIPAFDDEYFAQLTAEKLVTKQRGARQILEWVATRARNEALDCWLYALVALRLCGADPTIAEARPVIFDPPDPEPMTSQAPITNQKLPARRKKFADRWK